MGDSNRSLARRKQILCSAEELLQHYGYAKTTVADIARRAGVGVGSVYLEFSSKDDIVAALAQHRHGSVLEAMRQVAAGSGTYADRLVTMLDERVAHFAHYTQQGQHGRDMVTCGCPAVGQVHARYRADEVELVAELLERANSAGEFSVSDAHRTARIILLLVDQLMDHPEGANSANAEDPTQDAPERLRCIRLGARLILNGLLHRSPD